MWAYEYEAGKFIAGEILGDTLYMYAPTGKGEKWVMNSEGVVLEYSSEPFRKSDEIIAGINAHYGTSFYQEDDIDKDFAIGETMPDWNAYEKILLPAKIFVAASLGNNGYSIGYIQQNKYVFYAENDQNTYVMSMQGNVIAKNVPIETSWNYRVKPALENNGFEKVTEYLTETKIYEVGGNVENIGEYQFIE